MKIFLIVFAFAIFGFLSLPQNAEAEDFFNEYISEYEEIPISCQSIMQDMDLTTSLSMTECIPQWLKTNVGWWENGKINDDSFVLGIEYLVQVGIIDIVIYTSSPVIF